MRPSMIKPEVNSTKMNHEVIDTQNTEQDHRKFLETGDDALYSAENMRKRAALKEDPQIRAWITMFFRTFSMQTKPWCAGHKNVTRYQVFAFELLCCKALFPPAAFNMEEALCSVEEDLQRDLGDREQMSFHEFSESLFEIVDMWTLTCEKDEYLIFLRNLYLRISEPSITGSRQFRRVDAVVSVETPDLTAILKEGEVLKADRELDDTEIQQMNDDFESSRQSDIELGIAPRGSGLEAQASEEAARPSRRTVAPGGGGARPSARLSAQAQRRSSVAATREMARARKRSRQVTLVEPSHSSDEDETDDDASSSRHASPRGGKRPVGGRDPTLARNNARGKYQGASEPIWRAPGRRNDSHEGEYDGYDGDGRAPKKKKDGTNMWLVGGVMRTRNTGVLRYLGPSDGHTLPQDALSRGFGGAREQPLSALQRRAVARDGFGVARRAKKRPGANRNVASLSSPKRKNGAPPSTRRRALRARAARGVGDAAEAVAPELAARREGPARRVALPDPSRRASAGVAALASARQLVPGDPGSSPCRRRPRVAQPCRRRRIAAKRAEPAVRVVEVGADPRGAASRDY
ncbi:hypothetical protein JL721_8011 [Aureococcus anophagefferens]|nr:hypothetical protein JL721_8011 [Aureococcus anophagefferens]